MGCRHQGKRFLRRWIPTLGGSLTTGIFAETDICCLCGHWLSLGPANDTGPHAAQVAVERRAAELAAEWDGDVWLGGFMGLGQVSPECEHAPLIERDVAEGRKPARDLADYLAGYLSLVIATHDAKGGE
jgi:hypothetical protein